MNQNNPISAVFACIHSEFIQGIGKVAGGFLLDANRALSMNEVAVGSAMAAA